MEGTVKSAQPLVSVITPVYNGEAYIAQCIESILAQTYSNWEYIIVNNRSTDGTLSIAEKYTKDPRIRIETKSDFLPLIANHNRAFSLISRDSKYCKVVSADDWIYPEAIDRMVDLAESQPSIGLVGSYQLSGGGDVWYVRNHGLPYSSTFISGRDICRAHLLGPHPLEVFGNPTSTLYRADLVRSTDHFFPNETAEADRSACYAALRQSDYGFVHQILSHERIHSARATETSQLLYSFPSSNIGDLVTYGSYYLSEEELSTRIETLLMKYYSYLASNALTFRDRRFWEYHSGKLRDVGYPLNAIRLSKAIATKLLFAPSRALSRFRRGLTPDATAAR
jgi:glycosyltransferase involved in cell wall biosynthesis